MGVQRFFSWWVGELRGLVPDRLCALFRTSRRTVRVEACEDGFAVRGDENGAVETIAVLSNDAGTDDENRRWVTDCLRRRRPARWRYGVYLDPRQVLRDRLRLPAAAAENLNEVLSYQIDRRTPFSRDEVYFDSRIIRTVGDAIETDLYVARRDHVDAAVGRARAAGLPVHFVTSADDTDALGQSLNLLPAATDRGSKAGPMLNRLLAVLFLLLAGTAVWLPMERDRRIADQLMSQVEVLRTEARYAERLREELDVNLTKLGFVAERKRQTASLTRVMNDLSELMPDNSWVSRFTFRDRAVGIVVHAPESSAIVRLIEESPVFANARMTTAVRRAAGSNRERFSLGFTAGDAGAPIAGQAGAGR